MPAALIIAGKDLRQRLRDRSAIVLGLIAPLLIAALGWKASFLALAVVGLLWAGGWWRCRH